MRSRTCESSEEGVTCTGEGVENVVCVTPDCLNTDGGPPSSLGGRLEGGDCAGWGEWSEWTPCTSGQGVQYRHRPPPPRSSSSRTTSRPCSQPMEMRHCDVSTTHVSHHPDLSVGAVKSAGLDHPSNTNTNSNVDHSSSPSQNINNKDHTTNTTHTRRLGVLYLVITGMISFILGGVACIGLYLYIQHHRKEQRKEEALWITSSMPPYSENVCNNVLSDNTCSLSTKLNNVSHSQDSLEMRMLNNLSELSYSDAFGSLRKGKVTVKEASTLQRNSMWTNLSINDDRY